MWLCFVVAFATLAIENDLREACAVSKPEWKGLDASSGVCGVGCCETCLRDKATAAARECVETTEGSFG